MGTTRGGTNRGQWPGQSLASLAASVRQAAPNDNLEGYPVTWAKVLEEAGRPWPSVGEVAGRPRKWLEAAQRAMETGPDRKGYTRERKTARPLAENNWRMHTILGATGAGLGETCGRARPRSLKTSRAAEISNKK